MLRERDEVVVLESHGDWWLIEDDFLVSVRADRRGSDLVLKVPSPAHLTDDETDAAAKLPREFVFHPGTPSAPGWRYEAGAWSGKQHLDPVATRVVRRHETVSLYRLDEHELEAQATYRRDVALLRNPTPARLGELAKDHDPESLAEAGGPERYAAKELAEILDEVESTVPSGERGWFARQRSRLAPSTAAHPEIWPASEDARLLAAVTRRYRSQDTIEIMDGWLAKLVNRDEGSRRGCTAGLVFPEPSCNSSRELHSARAAPPGQVSKLCYGFLQMSPRPPSVYDEARDCDFRPTTSHVYRSKRGFPFLLFVDAASRIVGAQLVGYMYAALYVAPGIPNDLLRAMLTAQGEELRRVSE